MLISSGTIYVLFAKSELQWWNSPNQIKSKDGILEAELMSLTDNKVDDKEEKVAEKQREKLSTITLNDKEKENL